MSWLDGIEDEARGKTKPSHKVEPRPVIIQVRSPSDNDPGMVHEGYYGLTSSSDVVLCNHEGNPTSAPSSVSQGLTAPTVAAQMLREH